MKTSQLFKYVFVMASLLIPFIMLGQSNTDKDKIAASQAGASPVYFEVVASEIPLVAPGSFQNEIECQVRSGIPGFLEKAQKGQDLVVAFIGGSITQANSGYRLQTARYLEQYFPKARFKWINAGVSGTGTDLGAFRIKEQVLQYHPDLIFIEFAVNGAYPDGMEGMIRQTIRHNPGTDICLLYTILTGQTAFYQKSELPANIKGLERVADYYGLPSVQLGMEAASLEAAGKLVWKTGTERYADKIMFSEDGIHPSTVGGNLYAAAIARSLSKMELQKQYRKQELPAPLITADWDAATMVAPIAIADQSKGWQSIAAAVNPHLQKFSGWFTNIYTASAPGASFRFRFKGDMIGVFDIGGPEVGQLEWIIDGKPVLLTKQKQGSFMYYQAEIADAIGATALNRFNAYCNNRYRGQFDVIRLPEGTHDVKVYVSSQKSDKLKILSPDQRTDIEAHPEKYDQSVIYLGRILIRGTVL
ncbi:SGNH/GDSL hydrolase family protein [Niabella hibiscisoli]|uniref:SGNH/GDSL hydrolase family protein n=1 Tax=Niabella hibiscisoli TaxID=1825928 RepID=UPI001F103FEE|nr:SGNH/GDSL hydrolase family protein [Niabella hibiscisoli]MCH5719503.1 SGNH/GDSL hydrolase family protein [Niabella hibiscisoli]